MGNHSPAHLVVLGLSLTVYILVVLLNALAGQGLAPFLRKTANVSDEYNTQITPSGWTFSIWGVIYSWLTGMLCYILSTTCRRNSYGYIYCSPPVLPYGFFIAWICNMLFNLTWLLLWDRLQMIAAFIFLGLIAFTNYVALFFSCHGLISYGAWLNTYHKADLWLIRVLVQNGLATYTTWTTIATLINLNIVLAYDAGMSQSDAGTVALSILLVEACVWFILENFVFEKHVRYILTIYPVVIIALSGNMTKNYNHAGPSRNGLFTAVLLALACVLFAARLILVLWRHFKQPLYTNITSENSMSPMEIAKKQKAIFS
ncbi:uncharacterized protein LOC114769472 [Denticeps clupeoides]|uniref:uncharacterized protein LOC114769472 n=1 Tax=Denticeps clupeoides TaxID=299321 RepID=UPI0010A2C821|nr:uncharacterized protein LOC114769472 [Denticeps clupeoides]XP_028818351.1 uncharacterized protein LOC114769472 [Denticeps clupeoides]XP_028818362.1 uncharacterized protein LOC114769472 [Denticeps clupeoides]